LPVDPTTGKLVEGDIQALTTRIIDNIEAILTTAGSSLDKVTRTDVFLTDLKDFVKMNEIYAARFKGAVLPARQTIQVSALPMGASVEISCIALES
jgi:2-iminobutanoate/2-iminopropanoate deaminase